MTRKLVEVWIVFFAVACAHYAATGCYRCGSAGKGPCPPVTPDYPPIEKPHDAGRP
jgi:hypothetical protein